jgi:hypothetical protein
MGVVVFGLVVAAGCHHPPGLLMTPHREAKLVELASRAIECPRAEVVVQFGGSIDKDFHLYRVTGCGKQFEAIMACRAGRPGRGNRCLWLDVPDRHAAVDLDCQAPNELHRSYAGEATFEVTGCGRSARYTNVEGRWVSEARPTPTGGPATQPASTEDDD